MIYCTGCEQRRRYGGRSGMVVEFDIKLRTYSAESAKDIKDFVWNFPKEGVSTLKEVLMPYRVSLTKREVEYLRHDKLALAEMGCFLSESESHEKQKNYPTIKKVIFNPPATIVYWSDGDKTVVKHQAAAQKEIAPGVVATQIEQFDPEKGLAMAVSKKFLGKTKSHYDYYEEFKKWLGKLSKKLKKKEKK